jgi:uncharacterized protein
MKRLRVRVKPSAREAALEELGDGTWIARVKAPPVDGKANAALIELISVRFGVPKSRVRLKSGASARVKQIEIDD